MAIKNLCGRLLLHSNQHIKLNSTANSTKPRERVLFTTSNLYLFIFFSLFVAENSFFLFFSRSEMCVCFEFLCSLACSCDYLYSFEAAAPKKTQNKIQKRI